MDMNHSNQAQYIGLQQDNKEDHHENSSSSNSSSPNIVNDSHHQPEDEDEEAQLLSTEDYIEEFEVDDTEVMTKYNSRARHHQKKPGIFHRLLTFVSGSSHRQRLSLSPCFLGSVQSFPRVTLERFLPASWQRATLLVFGLLLWLTIFSLSLIHSKGTLLDTNGEVVRHLDCVSTLWGAGNECGVDGERCKPFGNVSFTFRCPADCRQVQVLNPRWVGERQEVYRPWVIGGGNVSTPLATEHDMGTRKEGVYRGDSFICQAAMHAGVISDSQGGCGVVGLVGEYYSFFGGAGGEDITSLGFDSWFPMAFSVRPAPSGQKCPQMEMKTARSLAPTVLLTFLVSVLTTSATTLFFISFVSIFVHVGLVSDPPNVAGPTDTILPQLISILFERLLPATFAAAVLFYTCSRSTTLRDTPSSANLEKTILWLGALWVGALSNFTLESWIPLSRLSAHDLREQPGAVLALIGILAVITLTVAYQAYCFWLERRVLPYLAFYSVVLAGLAIGAIVSINGWGTLELRIHHYVLALLLFPLTSIQTRPALVYQGLLLGLFVNGIARWGFDSVIQTAEALRGSDGLLGSSLVPVVDGQPLVYLREEMWSIAFKWKGLNETLAALVPQGLVGRQAKEEMDRLQGVSVMVNDVERYRRYFAEETLEDQVFRWERDSKVVKTPEYFRFAFLVGEDGMSLDYSGAGTWFGNGTWSSGPGFY
ncbi:hypothetical protein B0T20DRAFT_79534 [Sordaria brevicollis]|uniref:LCCL domain-containing protein n=1 Tax=Sordaria brevicollis TaxID=83679 RepID=A0AAE0P173_SORBR|nr:hypothetical protein B0T20DRAFT_79534 [Sordaria brevicollis]